VYYFRALACNNFAYHSLLLGQPQAAQVAATQGLRVAETHELVGALLHLYSTQGEIRLYQADWESAAEWFERGLALAEELGSLERQAGYRAGLALATRGQGDLAGARALLDEARALITERSYWHLRTRILLWLAETWLLDERADEAQPYLDEALATARTQSRALLLVQGERLRGRLLAARGDWPGASAVFADTLERATRLDLPLEIARTQAAWAKELLRHTPNDHEGLRLLTAAHEALASCDARADLALLPIVLQR